MVYFCSPYSLSCIADLSSTSWTKISPSGWIYGLLNFLTWVVFFFFFFNCLKVLPSLDLSFQINPCPSRLHEFLVRMDIINKTSSEVFQIHQLSSIGQSWELSLLQPVDTMFPSRALMPSQALSCFFVLKVFTRGWS